MKTLAALAATATLAFFAAPAAAQDPVLPPNPQDAADMQCMALVVVLMGTADEAMAAQLSPGLFYYLGRLEGRTPGTDWINVAGEYAALSTVEQLFSVQQRCAAEMTAKGREMIEKGEAMQRRGT
ncbi:MAG: hypothetical protein KJ676_01945 [Alphaproteobacteria bacterium]|nr:hypothetical protein [Alphaproteobacteria bacterium]MBU1538195.1 hypothetical protein [Alphaproteobacteria bacterium]MBU2115995.1 hypothetical protein [Alphaproteobacteria bacterium]MBU2352545.1 hypothetical protein [Alphaproteobacteria bacterium]MBU2381813.1 hypothetical protein [Alphaproteobacteria bacterium]